MGIMIVNEFEIRSYGWQELAVLYGPDLMPESAGKRLSKWVGGRPGVRDGAAGLRLAEREEDVDTPAGEDNRAVFG